MYLRLLSIIIPLYNCEKYISRCLDSIINQSYKNIEIIVVDDNSTDDSKNIAYAYSNKYPNIKLLCNDKNSGVGHSRNIGLENSSGEYIGFVDSDDWVDLNFFSCLMDEANLNNYDVVLGGVKTEYSNNLSSRLRYNFKYKNTIDSSMAIQLLTKSCNQDSFISPMVTNKVYKKSFLSSINLNFISNSYNEDDVFTFIVLSRSSEVCLVSNAFYHYFQNSASITHSFSVKHVDDLFDAFDYLWGYIKSSDLDIQEHIINAYFERCLAWVLRSMYDCIQRDSEQRRILEYIALKLCKPKYVKAFAQYIDHERIRNFFSLYS